MVIEDESAATFLEAFDHVMLPIAVVDPTRQVSIVCAWIYCVKNPL